MVNSRPLSGRALKRRVYDLLKSTEFDRAIEELCLLPARRVINPLFSFLHHNDQKIKWAAVTAMGAVVAKLGDEEMESARVIMRRLMWNLNDESGGIGWGSPEAMGEILAGHGGLAEEYAHVLLSYVRKNGNYLEHDLLQRGLLWAIGRLCQVRPHMVRGAVPHLLPYLESGDAHVRGLAAWVMGLLGVKKAGAGLKRLLSDSTPVRIYLDRKLVDYRVMDLAEQALNPEPVNA